MSELIPKQIAMRLQTIALNGPCAESDREARDAAVAYLKKAEQAAPVADMLWSLVAEIETIFAGTAIAHDKSGKSDDSYSAGYTKGFGECLRILQDKAGNMGEPSIPAAPPAESREVTEDWEEWIDEHFFESKDRKHFLEPCVALVDLRARLSAQAPTHPDSVPMPQNADQAELMQKLGYAWLRDNAPERLQPAQRELVEAAAVIAERHGRPAAADDIRTLLAQHTADRQEGE